MENNRPHIVIENHIPFIQGLLEPYADVEYLATEDFTPDSVKDADAIVVRTRTRCDASLLQGSKCKLVATATIGTDHIDLPWCQQHGIRVSNAPGCNAPAVAQYVFSSLLNIANRPLSQYAIGIVGVGHVGSIVERWARHFDMNVLVNDPPRQAAEGGELWCSLDEIAQRSDIITFHTPLDPTTRHMLDNAFVDSLQRAPIIINAARGPVCDNDALLRGLKSGKIHHAIIDCWENEPNINRQLLDTCTIATPHIAGYSYEGKARATRMAVDAVCQALDLPHIEMSQQVPDTAPPSVNTKAILSSYDPMLDTQALKASPQSFEKLRNNYNYRHEAISSKID